MKYKKMLLIFLVLPALACYGSNKIYATIAPTVMATPRIKIPSPTGTKEPMCIVTALETLNIRAAPGTDSAVVAVFGNGDELTVLSDAPQGNWIRVRKLEIVGWINSNYCKRKN